MYRNVLRIVVSAGSLFFTKQYKSLIFISTIISISFFRISASDSLKVDLNVSEIESTMKQLPVDSTSTFSGNKKIQDSVSTDSDSTDSNSIHIDSSGNSALTVSDSISNIIKPVVTNRIVRKRKSEKKEDYLYPGISREQDRAAMQMIHKVYDFDWDEAHHIAMKMQKLESRSGLAPLSYLLMVSMRIVRIQNSEFKSDSIGQVLLDEIDSLVKVGLTLANPSKAKPEHKSTYMFIYSGIEGFSATLKISKRPIDAAIEGFNALKTLEKLTETEPLIKDVYLGLGVFYCALAKAPVIVRGALNISGREVSFEKGINYLRISAYQGRYTNETAKQYLIQFLNPYMGDESAEKERVFHSLQQSYPKNAYYQFLNVHEDICFHQEKITGSYKESIKKRLSKYREDEYSVKRYAILIGKQYAFLDTLYKIRSDSSINLREFTFYPVFLNALAEKYSPEVLKKERYRRMHFTSTGVQALKLLEESSMSSNRKNFFGWYIRDALRDKEEDY